MVILVFRGTLWRSWLKHCATCRKVAGSIAVFYWYNPSGATMALGSPQPQRKGVPGIFPGGGGKGGRCVRLTTLPPSCAECNEIREHQSRRNLRACTWIPWRHFIACIATVGRQEDNRSHHSVVPAFVSVSSWSHILTVVLFSAPSFHFLVHMFQYSHLDAFLTFSYPVSKVKSSQSAPETIQGV